MAIQPKDPRLDAKPESPLKMPDLCKGGFFSGRLIVTEQGKLQRTTLLRVWLENLKGFFYKNYHSLANKKLVEYKLMQYLVKKGEKLGEGNIQRLAKKVGLYPQTENSKKTPPGFPSKIDSHQELSLLIENLFTSDKSKKDILNKQVNDFYKKHQEQLKVYNQEGLLKKTPLSKEPLKRDEEGDEFSAKKDKEEQSFEEKDETPQKPVPSLSSDIKSEEFQEIPTITIDLAAVPSHSVKNIEASVVSPKISKVVEHPLKNPFFTADAEEKRLAGTTGKIIHLSEAEKVAKEAEKDKTPQETPPSSPSDIPSSETQEIPTITITPPATPSLSVKNIEASPLNPKISKVVENVLKSPFFTADAEEKPLTETTEKLAKEVEKDETPPIEEEKKNPLIHSPTIKMEKESALANHTVTKMDKFDSQGSTSLQKPKSSSLKMILVGLAVAAVAVTLFSYFFQQVT